MKITLLLACLLYFGGVHAATYYVATNGNDSDPGTIVQPWRTLQKGFNALLPGDTLFIRGGTYSPAGTISAGHISGVVANGKKGTSARMFNVIAYPGEKPVLDCSLMTNPGYERVGILLISSDYWYIKGIEITRADQYRGPPLRRGQGLLIQSGNNNRIESVAAHHNGGPGLVLRDQSEGNLFINCDSYNNFDPYTATPGDDADGFDIGFIAARPGNDRINTLFGCRSWSNSDDGFDMFQYPGFHGIYVLRNCWSWKNGYAPDGVTPAGDGNGFKLGADKNYPYDGTIRRTLTNCIAFANRQRGFSQESANVKMLLFNNLAYKNVTWGFSFYYYDVPDILRNNLSYMNKEGQIENQGVNRIHDHNSWDSRIVLSDADFVSLKTTELSNPRKPDGSLPEIKCFHLSTRSHLIDRGIDVGLPYSGAAPDIGAFEFNAGPVNNTIVDSIAPGK